MNKFEKLVHLVGFIIRINDNAWSPERQIHPNTVCSGVRILKLVLMQFPSASLLRPKYLPQHPVQHLFHVPPIIEETEFDTHQKQRVQL